MDFYIFKKKINCSVWSRKPIYPSKYFIIKQGCIKFNQLKILTHCTPTFLKSSFPKVSIPFPLSPTWYSSQQIKYYREDDLPFPFFPCYILPHSHNIPFSSSQLNSSPTNLINWIRKFIHPCYYISNTLMIFIFYYRVVGCCCEDDYQVRADVMSYIFRSSLV